MSNALKFPNDANARPLLERKISGRIRGSEARRRALLEWDQQARQREGLLHTILICGCLWAGFWVQFLIGWTENQPALHTLTGGKWYDPGAGLFMVSSRASPFSIAQSIFFLSAFGSLMAMVGGGFYTWGLIGRWRMRIAICLFAFLTTSWSWATLAAEQAAWDSLKIRRSLLMEQYGNAWQTWERQWLKEQVRHIDWMRSNQPRAK